MYHRYFGLKEPPFSISVDPRYLFMSQQHRDALAHLLFGVGQGGGFILLTGEVGTGKTTVTRCLLEQLPDNTDVAMVLNPALDAPELLASVCDELRIDYPDGERSLKNLGGRLHRYLLDNHREGRNTVLMIDEAQHLSFEVLEQIRLLTNLETNTKKLLQIVLVGQPELQTLLSRPQLRQLSQRITARFNLKPLSLSETRAYIRHRLQVAGLPAGQVVFRPGIVRGVYKASRGIPRIINVLCDRMLLGAYARDRLPVDRALLRQARREVLGQQARAVPLFPWRRLGTALAVATLAVTVGALFQPVKALFQSPTPAIAEGPTPLSGNVDRENADTPSSVAMSPGVARPSYWVNGRKPALLELAAYHQLTPTPGADPCESIAREPYRCETREVDNWPQFRAFNRPAVIELNTPGKRLAQVVLVGIDADSAIVLSEGKRRRVSLERLGRLWSGRFIFFRAQPVDYRGPVGRGDRSELVRWVAARFAELDSQEQPLAAGVYNRALESRVRLFQKREGLTEDGVVGLKTLLKLHDRLGLSKTLESMPRVATGG